MAEAAEGSRHPHHLHQERGRAEFVFEWYGWTSSAVPWLFHSSYFMSYCRTTIGAPPSPLLVGHCSPRSLSAFDAPQLFKYTTSLIPQICMGLPSSPNTGVVTGTVLMMGLPSSPNTGRPGTVLMAVDGCVAERKAVFGCMS